MLFLKEHLTGENYTWLGELESGMFSGEPRRRLFDRLNGNHVLYMINFFMASIGKLSVQEGQQLETLIQRQLPDDIKSEISVFNWLRGIYLYHMH